jgi:hypothetical protein
MPYNYEVTEWAPDSRIYVTAVRLFDDETDKGQELRFDDPTEVSEVARLVATLNL